MAEKRVSVRLAAVGGRQVRAELEGVGEAGSRGFGRLSREMEAAKRPARGVLATCRCGCRCCRGSRCRRWRGDDPLRPADGRCASEARAVARDYCRLDPDARAGGRAGGRVDVRHRAGHQGSDAPTQPGGRRDWSRRRRTGPAGAFGQRADRSAAGPARRRDQRRHRELRARCRTRPLSRASSSARKAPSPCRGSTPRRCARRPRTSSRSEWSSPNRTPTRSSGRTMRSLGSVSSGAGCRTSSRSLQPRPWKRSRMPWLRSPVAPARSVS